MYGDDSPYPLPHGYPSNLNSGSNPVIIFIVGSSFYPRGRWHTCFPRPTYVSVSRRHSESTWVDEHQWIRWTNQHNKFIHGHFRLGSSINTYEARPPSSGPLCRDCHILAGWSMPISSIGPGWPILSVLNPPHCTSNNGLIDGVAMKGRRVVPTRLPVSSHVCRRLCIYIVTVAFRRVF